jgi:hypothetical protein
MARIYWLSDGVGKDVNTRPSDGTPIPTILMRWIRSQGTPDLIVNGGDVYGSGKPSEFATFLLQADNDVTRMCETAGNHDWKDDHEVPGAGRIPAGYESFWASHQESRQPIDTNRKGGARYEHFIDLDGWRLLFLDTGDYSNDPWPGGDQARVTWLKDNLKPGRANIVFAHHSRLSFGNHGDNDKLNVLWQTLFDASGPRAAFTLGGHDHNVSVYRPRPRNNPAGPAVSFASGIHVFVNGAGGRGHYSGGSGTEPDIHFDGDNFCVTRIDLVNATTAKVDLLSFGNNGKTPPKAIDEAHVTIQL